MMEKNAGGVIQDVAEKKWGILQHVIQQKGQKAKFMLCVFFFSDGNGLQIISLIRSAFGGHVTFVFSYIEIISFCHIFQFCFKTPIDVFQ